MERFAIFETAAGHAAIAWREEAVTGFRLPSATAREAERAMLRRHPDAVPDASSGGRSSVIATIVADARRYFAGEAVDFSDVRVDLGAPEPLVARIYAHVRGLPRSATTTYGAVARALELGPEFARDVGQAMARNPVPLIIPCHRVLGAGGKVGGFSAPGGSAAKLRMLALEGVAIADDAPAQQAFAF